MNTPALKRYLPILQWLPQYRRGWLRPDFIAGLTVWMVMTPEAMAYAGIAHVPPLMGLITVTLTIILVTALGLAQVKDPVFGKLRRMEVIDVIGVNRCFKSVKKAVSVFEQQRKREMRIKIPRRGDAHGFSHESTTR